MEKHKEKALEDDCLCSKCVFRFQCFTQERLFSDPILQGLFEALMAQGKSKEEALDEVTNEIKSRMNRVSDGSIAIDIPTIQPYVQPWVTGGRIAGNDWGTIIDSGNISFNDNNGKIMVSYTMQDGRKVSWEHKPH